MAELPYKSVTEESHGLVAVCGGVGVCMDDAGSHK